MNSSEHSTIEEDIHGDIPTETMEDNNIDPLLQNTEISQDKNIIYIKNMLLQIEQMFLVIKDIHERMNKLQEENEAPTGCAFSCTNISLNM